MLIKNEFTLNFAVKIILVFALAFTSISFANAQEREIIQFSGVVIAEDSTTAIPGVHVYVPKAGRGTTTNRLGYFSMPTLTGDTVTISAVGFVRKSLVIPRNVEDQAYSVILTLREDTTYLEEVQIFPYPTEELFKEAVLALQLPDQQQYENLRDQLDPATMAAMSRQIPNDGNMNHRYFMQMQNQQWNDRFGLRSNNLLNPFAWAEFIRSIKRGDFKKEK
ncbi:MAG: carboxypeptidase-like regulatory domain-containing protein [Cyclobacteriaceae bacterium]